ncbi:protein NRT1/ PTR FAMILY 5.10-like isoform X1 [Vitis riparia]|uniref:protein NRT1/ PTR FAMILY 5.10-like isoform X1 n=1 Tax=Vitis riparia TaxID=96939 RepID=UPI00155A189A|nr:protein NRT1/ PTR FAMILY 5.10-like isoform X1 [Vitis riparia]
MAANGMVDGPESPLLEDTVAGAVDYRGLPAKRSTSGGWSSSYFIIGTEVAERSAYFGIEANLVNYFTGPLGQSTAMAAKNVNTWFGITTLLPLVGAFVADSYMGRYRTILIASLLYILGLGLLTMSAVLSSQNPSECQSTQKIMSCPPPQFQVILLFLSLYLVALAEGGHKPCTQAFGADQFDGRDSEERKAKSSYFNWLNFCAGISLSVSMLTLSYIQDQLNWVLGFGIPCILMVVALLLFLLGTNTYRYSVKREDKNQFVRISKVFVEAARNWKLNPSSEKANEEGAQGTLSHQCSPEFKFLNKALLETKFSAEDGKACSVNEVEEAKAVLRLFPIWSTCLIYAMVLAQSSTFFTEQGMTMDRSIGSGFDIPSSSLKSFLTITMVLFIPIYDLVFVPIATVFSRKPSGITMLQRIGIGMFLSAISIAIAALVEMKRLKIAQEHGLVDMPNATVPMGVWWLVPQYVLFGLCNVFTTIGLQEFFYDQVPNELRSIGVSLYLSIIGVGSFLSSFLIYLIEKATGGDGQDGWFNDNLNKAHLDYFYWLLSGLNAVGLAMYMHFAKSYIYNRRGVP